MREALWLTAMLATLAALVRAAGRTGVLGVVGGVLAGTLCSFGAWLDAPAPLRGAYWLGGIVCLCKTLALGRVPRGSIGGGRGLAFLLLWPGIDVARAFVPDSAARRGRGLASAALGAGEVLGALGFIALADRRGWLGTGDYVPAWCRLVAFGALLDGAARAVEGLVEATGWRPERVFRAPWKMRDLADFWGERWNRLVGETLAMDVFRPTKRRFGRTAAFLLTFFESGVLHEALFRGSADGPDGRYVVFFVLHGLAVAETLARRPIPGRSAVIRRAVAWAILLATAPLFFGGCFPAVMPLERVLAGRW